MRAESRISSLISHMERTTSWLPGDKGIPNERGGDASVYERPLLGCWIDIGGRT